MIYIGAIVNDNTENIITIGAKITNKDFIGASKYLYEREEY